MWPDMRYYPSIQLEGLRKHEKPTILARIGLRFQPGTSRYEAGVPPTQRLSVWQKNSNRNVGDHVPSTLRARPAAVALPSTSVSPPGTFIGLVFSQLELVKIKSNKVNHNFLLLLETYKFYVCYGPFPKIAAPPPDCPSQANPITAAQKTPHSQIKLFLGPVLANPIITLSSPVHNSNDFNQNANFYIRSYSLVFNNWIFNQQILFYDFCKNELK
jgi:hypothetical protein